MEIKVKNCNDCPFIKVGRDETPYCDVNDNFNEIPTKTDGFSAVDTIPDFCPLKKQSITVNLS